MLHLWRPATASLPGSSWGGASAAGPQPGCWNHRYRQALMAMALAAFLAHIVILEVPGLHVSGPLWSNIAQSLLGILAVLALVEAGRSSGRFGRRIWFLGALAVGIYSTGQAILTCYRIQSPGHVTDQFFFFWMVPLLAAAAADPASRSEGFDWTSILDFAQLLLLAVALHLFVFSDASRWQTQAEHMGFLKWQIRLIRDAVVLACLWCRTVSGSRQIRALFLRLGVFYLAYTLADAVYLYTEASRHILPGTWLDLLWSLPRLLAVLLALTWNWPGEAEPSPPATGWRRRCMVLFWAPSVAPLAILALSVRMLSSAPGLWTALIVAAFGIASVRLLLTQLRQEHALERLHSSNDLLESVIEGTSEAIYMKDVDGRYLLINTGGAGYLGRTPADIVGKTDHDLFPADTARFIRISDRQVMDSGQPMTVEETLSSDGKTRTFLSTKNPCRDPLGRINGVLGLSLDITDRRAIEEQLRQAQRMESIGTFSGGIAHDFNNLLTVIKGYSQLALLEPEEKPAPLREYVEQIDKAAGRASSLIGQLLAFSRRQILKPRVISLNDVVSSLQTMLPRLIGEDVEIQTILAPELGAVKADPGQMEQVLMNLAANARDAMPAGGRLTVETANMGLPVGLAGGSFKVPPGAYALLAVSDTGAGMDAQTQARIFEPFFTTKPPGKGTGLGLATVYGIVKQSGGYIFVASKPGSGTTFRIYLPRVSEPVEPASQSPARVPAQGGHHTILLVDDDQQLRELARTILARSGFTVMEAENAEQAERVAAGHAGPIHLLLADVVMPGISGREIARRVCGERPETRVLYMSGYTTDTIVHHGVLEAGISFLPKPFTPERLVEKVREVLLVSTDMTLIAKPRLG